MRQPGILPETWAAMEARAHAGHWLQDRITDLCRLGLLAFVCALVLAWGFGR
jgi:hypothetical protein